MLCMREAPGSTSIIPRLENCADRNLIKLNTEKYRVLQLGRNNPRH